MLGYIKNSNYKKIAVLLGMTLLMLYIIENSFLLNIIGYTVFTYGVKSSCFIIVALLISYKIPKIHLVGREAYRSTIYVWAFNCGIIYMSMNILGGVIQGFGKSPYSHTLMGILTNIFIVGSTLIGRESIRAYIVNSFMRKNSKWAVVSIILLMTLTNITVSQLLVIGDMKSFTIVCAETILPELCNNILATYLVLYGGKWASIIYLGIIEAVMWLSPILPALNWLGKGVIGMMIPVFCLIYIISAYMKISKRIKVYKEKQESLWEWIPMTVGSVLFIWFVAGVFAIYPSAIATGSMEPMIKPGDVIIIEKMKDMEDIEALKVGDVIQFKREDILITHRVVEVLQQDGIPSYRTKGDNNSSVDSEIVKAENVKGILKQVVPKVGWPTLIFKSGNPEVIDEVEF